MCIEGGCFKEAHGPSPDPSRLCCHQCPRAPAVLPSQDPSHVAPRSLNPSSRLAPGSEVTSSTPAHFSSSCLSPDAEAWIESLLLP